jgi:hypothetical protein
MSMSKLDTFIARNQSLLKKHSWDEIGTWEVFGEEDDPGPNGRPGPSLGLYRGTLESVARYAVELSRFWNWGAGGRIEKYDRPILDIGPDSWKGVAKAREELKSLEAQSAALQETIKNLRKVV